MLFLVLNSLAVAVQILRAAQIDALVDGELELVVGEVRVAHNPRVRSHLVVKLGDGIPAFGSVSEVTHFKVKLIQQSMVNLQGYTLCCKFIW